MIDIAVAQEGFKKNDISNIALIKSGYNIANGLTKQMSHSALQNAVS